jgi:superfamily II DNA or RNA helicase
MSQNNEKLYNAMQILNGVLAPFVNEKMTKKYGDAWWQECGYTYLARHWPVPYEREVLWVNLPKKPDLPSNLRILSANRFSSAFEGAIAIGKNDVQALINVRNDIMHPDINDISIAATQSALRRMRDCCIQIDQTAATKIEAIFSARTPVAPTVQLVIETPRNEPKPQHDIPRTIRLAMASAIPGEHPYDGAWIKSTSQKAEHKGHRVPVSTGGVIRGFWVQGLPDGEICMVPKQGIFALVFNFLQRCRTAHKPAFYESLQTKLGADVADAEWRFVFRAMIAVLLAIKCNSFDDGKVKFNCPQLSKADLRLALECLNEYIACFSRLAGIEKPAQIIVTAENAPEVTLEDDLDIEDIYGKGLAVPRVLWETKKIRYSVSAKNKNDFDMLLREIAPTYDDFLQGQLEALIVMLNARTHTVCVMPTGQGKSLIYYICAVLQPCPTVIFEPTDLLIEDQTKNLDRIHHFDHMRHIRFDDQDQDFSANLIFLTPETFLQRDLRKTLIYGNYYAKLANVVVDEVHCFSNLSHDFRPEYLMLVDKATEYLNNAVFLCFTATADATVMKDVLRQLHVGAESVVSPVKLEKRNIRLEIIPCDTDAEMRDAAVRLLRERSERTLVFTKTDDISKRLFLLLKENGISASTHKSGESTAVRSFAEGITATLIGTDEIGVGLNLPGVRNVLHFGIPLSMGDFAQQIGRAGRDGEDATATVLYLRPTAANAPQQLLSRDTHAANLAEIMETIPQNDYRDAVRCMTNDIPKKEDFRLTLNRLYEQANKIPEGEACEISFNAQEFKDIKRGLYGLYKLGIVSNWSLCKKTDSTVVIMLARPQDGAPLALIKENLRQYFSDVGGSSKYLLDLDFATTLNEVFRLYADWYFNHFIFHRHERFLAMVDFCKGAAGLSQECLRGRLSRCFTLNMVFVAETVEKYRRLTYPRIVERVYSADLHTERAALDDGSTDEYHAKLDFALLTFGILDGCMDCERLKRVFANVAGKDSSDFLDAIAVLYGKMRDPQDKFLLFSELCRFGQQRNVPFSTLFDAVFRSNPPDIVYYGVMANQINNLFTGEK